MIKWFIDKNNRIPLYLQLKDTIKYYISTGAIQDNDQLPGVVQLAEELKVNFETVRKAYKELEKEKLVVMNPGRGTFATLHKDALRRIKPRPENGAEPALQPVALLKKDISQLIREGRSAADVRALMESILADIFRDQSRKYVIFTECNLLQVREISQKLGQSLKIIVKPVLLADLRQEFQRGIFPLADLLGIITTGFHANEVKALIGDLPVDIDILITNMSPETMGQLSALDKNSRFGFICRDRESIPLYQEILKSEFSHQLNLITCTLSETEKTLELLNSVDLLLATPPVLEEVKKLAAGKIPVFCTFDRIDPQSLNIVKDRIIEKLCLL